MKVTKFNLREIAKLDQLKLKFRDYPIPFKFNIAEYRFTADLEGEFEKNKLNLAPMYMTLNADKEAVNTVYREPMVMAVDPGTTSMGVTLGSLRDKNWKFLTTLRFQRGDYEDATTFTAKFSELLKYILKNFNIVELVIESQYDSTLNHIGMNKNNIDKLKTIRQTIEGIFQINNLPTTVMTPNLWKADFLGDRKEMYGIKRMNASNKEYVYRRCTEMFMNYFALPKTTDCSDSIGILNCFFNKNLSKSKYRPADMEAAEVVRGSGQTRKINGFVKEIKLLTGDNINGQLEEIVIGLDKVANKYNLPKINCEFNRKMTIEENIRTLLSNSNALYYGIFTLNYSLKKNGTREQQKYLKILPELYDLLYENTGEDTKIISPITAETIIIAYGYSTN